MMALIDNPPELCQPLRRRFIRNPNTPAIGAIRNIPIAPMNCPTAWGFRGLNSGATNAPITPNPIKATTKKIDSQTRSHAQRKSRFPVSTNFASGSVQESDKPI
ncbi:hypothetical protein Q31b_36630 [Novipirellula aureliae]|uniref:Uncharacterized protein n=1 Tax=Novipirellula aureliae TaxID=2527966 RepID=A0A5C6DVE7_9BACT|nr:hypothetical protein Q31b_36630 [Novipirellula aureliae]